MVQLESRLSSPPRLPEPYVSLPSPSLQMLRMASTEPDLEERREERRREAELQLQCWELGMTPRAASQAGQADVQVQIGAGHELDELSVIEPLSGGPTARGGWGGWRRRRHGMPASPAAAFRACVLAPASLDAHALLPCPAALLPPSEEKRIAIGVTHVSAHVPLLLQQPSLLSRLNPRALKRKISSVGTSRPTHRQVCARRAGRPTRLALCTCGAGRHCPVPKNTLGIPICLPAAHPADTV